MKVLVAKDIVKYHGGDLKVLAGASLAVESGEKIGLVGRNGAGKTTLLNVLSGATVAWDLGLRLSQLRPPKRQIKNLYPFLFVSAFAHLILFCNGTFLIFGIRGTG